MSIHIVKFDHSVLESPLEPPPESKPKVVTDLSGYTETLPEIGGAGEGKELTA